MERAEKQEAKVVKRRSKAMEEQEEGDSVGSAGDPEKVAVLKQRIVRLEAENKQLRKQIAASTDSASRSSQPRSDSVREQQHKFLKYSNVRRY